MNGFTLVWDTDGNLALVMCPICFEYNEPISARAGGMLSTTNNGGATDVCVDCMSKEYLVMAAKMGA